MAVGRLAQDVNCAVTSLADERSLTDVLHALIHPLARLLCHLGKVKAAIRLLCMRLLEVAKEPHCQIADLVTLL